MRFSQRHGYSPVSQTIQLEFMDEELRNSLWNALDLCYWKPLCRSQHLQDYHNRLLRQLCSALWVEFFKWPLDTMPDYWDHARGTVRNFFFECPWFRVYDCIEFITSKEESQENRAVFETLANKFLEQEMSGYRLISGSIVPITDETELIEVEEAISQGNESPSKQLHRSLEMLSDRENPDYRNSIKESISAVEGEVISTLGKESGTLGALLGHLEQRTPVHPALKEAFSKLYGYTSDEGGIRHALMDDSRRVTFEEAKFMLVACSAFVNYIRGVSKS